MIFVLVFVFAGFAINCSIKEVPHVPFEALPVVQQAPVLVGRQDSQEESAR